MVPNSIASAIQRRVKLAELTSSIGTGVLGIGIGAYFAASLGVLAVPMMIVGVLMHLWGMLDKHRLEKEADLSNPWWATILYWGCWATIVFGAGYLVLGRVINR